MQQHEQYNKLNCLFVEPEIGAKSAFIWIHGLNDSAENNLSLIKAFSLPEEHSVLFVLPQAPSLRLSIDPSFESVGWYDIRDFKIQLYPDIKGIEFSFNKIHFLLDSIIKRGIPPENIILGGFSQGGVIALHAAASFKYKLSCVIAAAAYIPSVDYYSGLVSKSGKETPIYMLNGRNDNIVSYEVSESNFAYLDSNGFIVQKVDSDEAHNLSSEQFELIEQLMHEKLLFNS